MPEWWPWSSKEETAKKNLQKYLADLRELQKKTNALDKQANPWTEQTNPILDEAITKSSTIQSGMSTAALPPTDPIAALPPTDPITGGTRKKRKNKKHKKKTFRH